MASTMALFFKKIFAPFALIPVSHCSANFSPFSLMRAVTKAWKDALLGAIPTLSLYAGLVRSATDCGSVGTAPGR